MTKHLRLIMLSLLAMTCLGGYAQTKSVVYNMGETPKRTAGDIEIGWSFSLKGNNDNQKPSRGYGWYIPKDVSITATMPKDTKVSVKSIIVNANTNNKKTNTKVEVKIDNTSIGVKSITKSGSNGDGNKDYVFNNSANTESNVIDFIINSPSSVWIKTITINYEEGSPTTTSFGTNYDGETFKFVDGKLEGWSAPTAKHTPKEAEGDISYKSDNEAVATVDAYGQLTFNGYGTAKITATFTPKETEEKYAKSSASYTVINKDPDVVEFVAGIQTSQTTTLANNGVTIYNSNGRLNENDGYRFYKGTTLRFSVQQGIITKIEMEGQDVTYSLKGIKLTKGGGDVSATLKTMIWKGLANDVEFSTSAQVRAATIRVTVKPHYTLDETVDNVIEAKENVYVTLKRTFYHDNAWNTLCLPFDVDANKVATAFAGAEIREIDLSQCKDNTIQFVPATEIKAGVPYIIKWNENVAEAQTFEKTFEGVTLVAEPKPVVNNDITFTGFYKMTAASELGGTSVAAIGAGSKLFTVGEGKMKGFRAAFVLSSNAQASKYKVVIDGTATGIEDLVIDSAKANGRVYNLNGQYVGNSLNGLQPGLYIQNGKKIVVK